MAEKRDGAAALLHKLAMILANKLSDEVERLPGPDSEDTPAPERIRQITLAAKAGREIAAMTMAAERAQRALEALRESNPGQDDEDNAEMNDAEPKDIEQVYADLQSRLDRLTGIIEKKRAAELGDGGGGEVELGGSDG